LDNFNEDRSPEREQPFACRFNLKLVSAEAARAATTQQFQNYFRLPTIRPDLDTAVERKRKYFTKNRVTSGKYIITAFWTESSKIL
jgi:hypothetical protein